MKKTVFVVLGIWLPVLNVWAQDVRNSLSEGNSLYAAGKFSEAETRYRSALEKNINSFEARFNLGNALYRQSRFTDAAREYNRAAISSSTHSKDREPHLANAQYNLGNALFCNKEYAKSIEAYKQTLRQNPQDEDARHNLALARVMLKQQPPQEEQPEMQQEIARQMLDVLQQTEQQPRQQHRSQRQVEKEW